MLWPAVKRAGENKTLNTQLDLKVAFFIQADEDSIADDDVIENLDPDIFTGFDQLFRSPDVFTARLWTS